MKITFNHYNMPLETDKGNNNKSCKNAQESRISGSSFALDISGSVMDNKAYNGQGKTAEDVMQLAAQEDIVLQRNYLTVMSNSMSKEDLAKMMEEGFRPGETPTGTVVTIVDKIKAVMAKSGTNVKGYTDAIDKEALSEAVGSQVLAQSIEKSFNQYNVPLTEENIKDTVQAVEEARQITQLSDDSKKYLVQNQMQPTIQNLYTARYSASGQGSRQGRGFYQEDMSGYYSRKADEYDWEQLTPQMKAIVEKAGLAFEETAMTEAKWLVEEGIALNEDNLRLLHEINKISFPLSDQEVTDAASRAVIDKRRPNQANLSTDKSILEQAVLIYHDFQSPEKEQEPQFLDNIKARRQLEEVRLIMTVEANRLLLESGFSIDTAPMENLIEKLKEAETKLASSLFPNTDEATAVESAALYEETKEKLSQIPDMPAAMVGRVSENFWNASVWKVYDAGVSIQHAYQKAGEQYELFKTSPRADLGDTIQKAFRNTAEILSDLDLEPTQMNERAVRILSYNSKEITKENISKVKEADQALQNIIQKMTPSAVLQMIRDGKNPLTMSMEELDTYLSVQQNESLQETEKYSKFLYKLEKNKEITKEEREAYVGIYRLLRQVEKSDGAVVGRLLEQGAELNLDNLLMAVRTWNNGSINVSVDDDFSPFQHPSQPLNSISDQILRGYADPETGYYKHAAEEILRNLSPEKLKKSNVNGKTTLDQLAEHFRGQDTVEESEESYRQEQIRSVRQIQLQDENALKELLDYKQPITMDHLMASNQLLHDRGGMFSQIRERAKANPEKEAAFRKASGDLLESFTEREEAEAAYEKLRLSSEEILEEAVHADNNTYIDVRAMAACHKQLTLAARLSKEENYEIPMELFGQQTSIRLKIVHDKDQVPHASITLETPQLGQLAADFTLSDSGVKGYLACSLQQGVNTLEGIMGDFKANLATENVRVDDLRVIKGDKLDLDSFGQNNTEAVQKETSRYYRIAKQFLKTLERGLSYEN